MIFICMALIFVIIRNRLEETQLELESQFKLVQSELSALEVKVENLNQVINKLINRYKP